MLIFVVLGRMDWLPGEQIDRSRGVNKCLEVDVIAHDPPVHAQEQSKGGNRERGRKTKRGNSGIWHRGRLLVVNMLWLCQWGQETSGWSLLEGTERMAKLVADICWCMLWQEKLKWVVDLLKFYIKNSASRNGCFLRWIQQHFRRRHKGMDQGRDQSHLREFNRWLAQIW